MEAVSVLIKPVSGHCNMKCKYCFYVDEMENRSFHCGGFMSTETLEVIVKKALESADASCTFAFQGGEPTLAGIRFYQKLIELEQTFNTKGIPITNTIQTNGFAIDEEWARFLADNHFLVGLSLDGNRHTHNAFRKSTLGEETFDQVMNTANMFREYGVSFNILTVVNSRTAPAISKIYKFYKKQGFYYQQYIACLDPVNRKRGEEEYSLTPESYGEFLNELFECWFIDLQTGTQPYIRMFENYVGILLGQEAEACDMKGFCSNQFVIEADGTVFPCDFYAMDDYRLGNIHTDSIIDLQQAFLHSGFRERSMEGKAECAECPYLMLCRGGCRRCRDMNTDGILSSNYYCESYKGFFQNAYPKLRYIANRICYNEMRRIRI